MPAIKKNRKPATRIRDPATGRFRRVAIQPVAVLPPCCSVPQLQDLAAVPVEPVIKIEPQEEEVDWKAEYLRWRDKYTVLKRVTKISESVFKGHEDLLKEYKKEHKRMIERLEDTQELHKTKIDELNLEVESLKRCLSNTGKRKWTDQIKNTVARKWPNRRKSGYTQVKVLMVRWESDDLGVSDEINSLAEVLQGSYYFDVSKYNIPDKDSLSVLSTRVIDFIGDSSPDTLLIFYYAGHGGLHDTRSHLLWSPTGDYGGLSIPSGGIQAFFEESGSDSLLIYDACHSAETAKSIDSHFPRSVTELIAACGFQTFAPGVGEHSLTHTLTKELRHLRTGDRLFSVSELFSRVLTRLKHTPSREDRTTPVHTTLTWEASGRCIMLEPLIHGPIPCEYPPDTMPLALFLDTQGELNTAEYEKWISNAPPSISNVYFKHPLLDKICVDGASRARTSQQNRAQRVPSRSNARWRLMEQEPRIKQERTW